MLESVLNLKARKPILALLLIALFPRLIAAVFAPGYFAHDDHFLVIESAQSWVDGFDYNTWLPWNQGADAKATGHSFFYVGIHFLLLSLFDKLSMNNPAFNMLLIRFVHALWSLLIVSSAYRIARTLSTQKIAWRVGLFVALFYYMPYLAVRNLPEMVCVPFIMLGAARLLSKEHTMRTLFVAGLCFGLAANVRFQTLAFSAGLGLVFLATKPFKASLTLALGMLLPIALIQGGIDQFIWGKPFVEIQEYVRYNLENRNNYISHPWYQYVIVILGILIPPLSFFILYGFKQIWKQSLALIGGLLLFFIVHSLIGNKQERFILPIMPLVMTLGATGILIWLPKATTAWQQVYRGTLRFAMALNFIVLVFLCFSYGKRSRVEIMKSLKPEAAMVTHLIVENSVYNSYVLLPQFYADDFHFIQWDVRKITPQLIEQINQYSDMRKPNYAVFVGEEKLEARIQSLSALLPGTLNEVARAEPGLLDKTLHWLNPINRNETMILTRLEAD